MYNLILVLVLIAGLAIGLVWVHVAIFVEAVTNCTNFDFNESEGNK